MNGIEDKVDKMIKEKESKAKQSKKEKVSGKNIDKDPKSQEKQKRESISAKNWLKIIIWTLIGIGILGAIVYYIVWPWIANLLGIEIPGWIGWVIQAITIIFFIWFLTWIRVVGPKEHGPKVFFGNLGEDYADPPDPKSSDEKKKKGGTIHGIYKLIYGYCKSGLHIVPRLPGCGIIKIPKTRFELDYAPRLAMSKRTKKKQERFGKQFLLVNAAVYTEFGRDYFSVKNAIERRIPTTEEALLDYTDSLVDSSIREAIGGMDWAEATEKRGREKIEKTTKGNIEDPNSIFSLGGFDEEKTKVVIKTIDLESKELKKALVKPDYQKLQKEGAIYESERIKLETQVIGKIRKQMVSQGFSEEKADEFAHKVYELNVSKDLQKETGMSVVKLIRFESNSALGNTIGEGIAAAGAIAGIMAGETMKSSGSGKSSEKEESSDKKKSKKSEEEESKDRKAGKALIERYSHYS